MIFKGGYAQGMGDNTAYESALVLVRRYISLALYLVLKVLVKGSIGTATPLIYTHNYVHIITYGSYILGLVLPTIAKPCSSSLMESK